MTARRRHRCHALGLPISASHCNGLPISVITPPPSTPGEPAYCPSPHPLADFSVGVRRAEDLPAAGLAVGPAREALEPEGPRERVVLLQRPAALQASPARRDAPVFPRGLEAFLRGAGATFVRPLRPALAASAPQGRHHRTSSALGHLASPGPAFRYRL